MPTRERAAPSSIPSSNAADAGASILSIISGMCSPDCPTPQTGASRNSPRKNWHKSLAPSRLAAQSKFGFSIRILGPGKGSLLQTLGHQPQSRAIPVKDFEPCVAAIGEHKERPTLQMIIASVCRARCAVDADRSRPYRPLIRCILDSQPFGLGCGMDAPLALQKMCLLARAKLRANRNISCRLSHIVRR